MSAFADDITVMESDACEVETVVIILKKHESVAGVKINANKLVGLLLYSWRDRIMPSDGVVGRWTDGRVKLIEIWFGPNLQVNKNLEERTNRVTSLTQKWVERKLSLESWTAIVDGFIVAVIVSRLTIVPCPSC